MARFIFLFLLAVILTLPLAAAKREKPKSADLSETVAPSPYRWEKMSETGGCTVHWAKARGSQVVAYRVEGILNAPLGEVASLFHPPAHPLDWLPLKTGPGRGMESTGEASQVRTFAPGPFFSPREFTNRVSVSPTFRPRGLSISVEPTGEGSIAPGKNVKGDFSGTLQLVPMTFPGQTYLRFEFHCQMNGKMPAWTVNFLEQSWPEKAFRALTTRVAKGGLKVLPDMERILSAPAPAPPPRKVRKPRRVR